MGIRIQGQRCLAPRWRGVAAMCLSWFATATAAQAQAPSSPPAWAPGRVLVQARAGASDADLARVAGRHGGRARRIGRTDLHIIDLPAQASETAVQALLAHHPLLEFAELDRRVEPGLVANDPYLGSEWHVGRIGAATAWDASQGHGVTIAILDSGVSPTHPDLAARLLPGWNFYDNNADTSDPNGHGTAVAGAAAAITNNAAGVAGIAGQANILPVRIADANAYAYWSTVAQGLSWAADHGARVANISYVGVAGSSSVRSAAQYMKNLGGLVVVCAGNNGIAESISPTTAMIPVSATDSADNKASWSSWGDFVALAAPGVGIWTTARSGGYEAWNGTSLASPVAAGVVALMMSARPELSSSQVESLLYASAADLGTAGRDTIYGHGRVDAARSVQAALAALAADGQAPSVAIAAPLGGASVSGSVNVDVNATDNVGVTQVELRVNGSLVATDTTAPFQFTWNSTLVPNGNAALVATAHDAAGNSRTSQSVSVSVSNAVAADGTPPTVAIVSPGEGSVVSGGKVTVKTSASDNLGASNVTQTLLVDGKTVASASGATLSWSWNLRKVASGSHTLQVVARDAAGNQSTHTVTVRR